MKTIEEINQKIREGNVCVVRADEMPEIVDELGAEKAAEEVDVVTTGTFGAMCSSGAFLNFGHSEPPIKMQRVWLNDVEAYTGLAAVDAYIGATQLSESRGMEYGGAHVIEDLVRGKSVELRATAYGTDCYPRKEIRTMITLEDLNQAIMVNPRNAYQRYNAATNSTDRTLYTYMGTLLPRFGNVTFSGAGALSPLNNDPEYRTIGTGTRIFLCGAKGYVVGEGTQHSPKNHFGTLMVSGNLKEMNPKFLDAATFPRYGTTLYVGIGIPIPILDEDLAKRTAIRDEEIKVSILDYGVASRNRPVVRTVSYAELKSGKVEINGEEVPVSPLSSYRVAVEIAEELKKWIEKGEFFLSAPAERIPLEREFKPMKQESIIKVKDIMSSPAVTVSAEATVEEVAQLIVSSGINHLPVVRDGVLVGIVTSFDIAKAVARGLKGSVEVVMTKSVITTTPEEGVESAARKMEQHDISALPVINSKREVIGIVTTEDLSKLVGRGRK